MVKVKGRPVLHFHFLFGYARCEIIHGSGEFKPNKHEDWMWFIKVFRWFDVFIIVM